MASVKAVMADDLEKYNLDTFCTKKTDCIHHTSKCVRANGVRKGYCYFSIALPRGTGEV